MFYGIGLTAALAILWLTLSGRWDNPLLLQLGAASVVFAVLMTLRMRILDRETSPFGRFLPLFLYWIWLFKEIIAANIEVMIAVLRPEMDINARLIRVPVDARSDLARCTFANSITLTPGTVTVEVEEDGFLVHALLADFASPEGFAEMGARVDAASDGARPQ